MVIAARGAARGNQAEHEIRTAGGKVLFVQADVSQAEQVQALVARTVETFGRLDCAFNNAAVLSKLGRTGDFSEAGFDAEVSSNLKSVWLCMKYELEQMRKQDPRGGAIVNTLSVNGLGERPSQLSIPCPRPEFWRSPKRQPRSTRRTGSG